jgi:hypothetical protein
MNTYRVTLHDGSTREHEADLVLDELELSGGLTFLEKDKNRPGFVVAVYGYPFSAPAKVLDVKQIKKEKNDDPTAR